MINLSHEFANLFRRSETKAILPEYPCAIGRSYTSAELKKIGEYMNQDAYFEIELGLRDNKIKLENISPYFSFSQEWQEKASSIIREHMLDMSLPTRRIATIKIRFVPQLWSEELKKSKPAEALVLGDPKKMKREVWIRIALNNDKTYATGSVISEIDLMHAILHEISELDSLLTTRDPEDPMFNKESERLSKQLISSREIEDAVKYNELTDEKIANEKARKTLLKFYTEREVDGANPISPFMRYGNRMKESLTGSNN